MRTKLARFFLLSAGLLISGCGPGADRQADEDGQVGLFTESGELMAVNNTAIVMPNYRRAYGEPQITWLEEEGKVVAPGDIVVLIDGAEVLKALENKEAELAISLADLSNKKMSQAVEINKLEGTLRQALSRLHQTEIDTQRVIYESRSRQEETGLQLEKAKISLEKARRKIESTKLLQEQDLIIQRIKISQVRRDIEMAKETLERFTVLAPAAGMIVHSRNRRSRTKVQVGDKLRAGNRLIQLPDLTRMKALTSVNETDINKVWVDQPVRVRLDAYPRVPFEGKITWISSTCRRKKKKSNIKIFDVEVLIEGSDKILKPGMTVSCEFLGPARELAAKAEPGAAGSGGE